MSKIEYQNFRYQDIYATILDKVSNVGLIILIGSYIAYAFGFLEPLVPLADMPTAWKLSLDEFIATTGAPVSWDWVYLLDKGDYLTFVGISILAGVTIVCYIAIFFKALTGPTPKVITGIIAIELVLLIFAASNLISGGH